MIIRKIVLPLLAALVIVACGEGEAPSKQTPPRDPSRPLVTVGTNPEYPPMQFIDKDTGKMVGFEVDLMAAIAEQGGFDIEWKSIEWKGIFSALEAKDIDAIMSAATITEERQKKYDFSDPYYQISQRLVVRREDAEKIAKIEDLKDKKIGVQLGTTGFLLVRDEYPEWDSATFDSSAMAFSELRTGSIFGFMVDEPVADAYARTKPETADLFVTLPFKFSAENYGIVMRKGEPELLEMINKGLAAVKEAGIDRDLQEKWIE